MASGSFPVQRYRPGISVYVPLTKDLGNLYELFNGQPANA